MRSEITVAPNMFEMGSHETLPISFDISQLLLVSETPTNAVTTLVQIDSGIDYGAGHPTVPSIQGTKLVQTLTALQAGKRYRLIIQFNAAAGKTWAPSLLISCPE